MALPRTDILVWAEQQFKIEVVQKPHPDVCGQHGEAVRSLGMVLIIGVLDKTKLRLDVAGVDGIRALGNIRPIRIELAHERPWRRIEQRETRLVGLRLRLRLGSSGNRIT